MRARNFMLGARKIFLEKLKEGSQSLQNVSDRNWKPPMVKNTLRMLPMLKPYYD
jgi:hypothetical protein